MAEMEQEQWSKESLYAEFYTYVSRMQGLSPSAKLVASAWRRLQDQRTDEHNRYDGFWLVRTWEFEEATGLVRSTVRDAINELVRFQIIGKRVIRATRNRSGELWLSKIFISSLESAQLNGDIPQRPVRPIARCSVCGSPHVVDTMTRTCECEAVRTLYQIDHGANFDQVIDFCNACLVKKSNCNVAVGTMVRLYKSWFFSQEEPRTKKPLKAEGLKRVFAELGIQYRVTHSFRRYEGVGLTSYAQQLLEDNK